MATSGNYYLNGPTLASATKIFTDSDLTICAADGWYSDGQISREQKSCSLLPQQICNSCLAGCDENIDAGGNSGIYKLSFSTGGAIGALIVYFNPQSVPDGLRAIYDSVVYNKVTSITYGSLKSNNSSNFTFLGSASSDCNIGNTLDGGGYTNQDIFIYDIAIADFPTIPNATNGVVTGTSGDVQLTATGPGYCTLVVPVLSISETTILLEVFGPCSGTAWDLNLNCPIELSGVLTSNIGGDCNTTLFPNTYYNVPNFGGTLGEPAIHEFFTQDSSGASLVPAGDYTINPASAKKIITVDSNGVIVSISTCPFIPLRYFLTDSAVTVVDACDLTTYPNQVYAQDDEFLLNDFIFTNEQLTTAFVGDSGYYKLNKDGGTILQIDSNGQILSVSTCPFVPSPYKISNDTGTVVDACAITTFPITVYAQDDEFLVGDFLFTNVQLTNPYVGNGTFSKKQIGDVVLQIDGNGQIIYLEECNPT